MKSSQISSSEKNQSITRKVNLLLNRLTAPHPEIKNTSEARRARFLLTITLLLSVIFVSAIFYQLRSYALFLSLAGVAIISYAFGKTIYHQIGAYLFAYVFTAIGFIRIFQGSAHSIEAAIVSTVHVSLIFASVLLSKRGFLGLVTVSTLATFAAPYYSNISAGTSENIWRIGGIVFVIGSILYGINMIRETLEQEQIKILNMANRKLEGVQSSLEERLGVRTRELEKANTEIKERALRLQVISELSQDISASVQKPSKEVLHHITQIISDKLRYYHVGIFLLDENLEYAILRAANSKGGQQMLARRHQLKVGGAGIVSYVAQSGHPRIALDTGTDVVFFNNPDLPDTHSEIALPLKFGDSIIGVLDVQSTTSSAFNTEDVSTLSTIANQVAIIFRNLEMVGTGASSSTAKYTGKRIGVQLTGSKEHPGYLFTPDGAISNVQPKKNLTIDKAIASGEIVVLNQPSKGMSPALAVPVKLRDQVIGFIHIESSENGRKWTEDEIAMVQAISERAALALENARLFENATRRAEQEETIAHVTTRIGASSDFNRILQTTIQELGQALGVSRTFIQLATPTENSNETTTE